MFITDGKGYWNDQLEGWVSNKYAATNYQIANDLPLRIPISDITDLYANLEEGKHYSFCGEIYFWLTND